jgi:uncharacterized membrane protein
MKSDEAPQTRPPASEAEGHQEEGASVPMDGHDHTVLEDVKTERAEQAHAEQAHAEPAPRDTRSFPPEAWGEAARATCLSFLLGMALVVVARFSLGGEWVLEFLDKNRLPMDARMSFIAQALALGLLCAVAPLGLIVSQKWSSFTAAVWEKWAWFLSPLMLLPAVPVMMKHQVWEGKHQDLLPIVLFGALIAEVLFSKSFANIPPQVARAVTRFLEDDEPVTSRIGRIWKEHHVLILVCLMAAAYGAFMSFYTIRWHHKLGTATFDLGINNNLLYGGLEGKFNQSPVIFPEDPQKYLANHVKIGLYSFLPIYVFYPKPETLLAVQSIAMGLGAIPLFLFARRRIPEWWALALAAVYLSYYPLHGANFYEMKLVPTASAWVLTCIWAIDAKRFVTGGIFFLWAMLMREDMPVPMAVVGAAFLLSGHRPRAGLLMALVASSWFVFLRFRFMNDVGNWWFPNMYEDLWAEPEKGFRGVIKTLVSNPTYTLKHIFVEKKFWYLMHLLVPMAFLPVRRWWAFAALIPGAILTLLVTDYAPPTMFSFQYVMHWAPYMYIAAALVLAQKVNDEGHAHSARAALVSMCLASLALTYNYGAFPRRDKSFESGYHKITFSFSEKERKTLEDVRHLVASIPKSASVASTERIGAHLSSRVGFYTLRRGSHGVDYIVANKAGLRLDRTKETVKKALESKEYGLVGRFGEFAVFKKGADAKGNEAVMSEWGLTSRRATRLRKAKSLSPDSDKDADSLAEDAMTEQLEAEIDDPGEGLPPLPTEAPRTFGTQKRSPLLNQRPRREETKAHE